MATPTRSSRLSESWRVILSRAGMCDRCGKPGKQRAIKQTAERVARSASRVCLCDECYQSLNALHALMWVWLREFLYLHPTEESRTSTAPSNSSTEPPVIMRSG